MTMNLILKNLNAARPITYILAEPTVGQWAFKQVNKKISTLLSVDQGS